MINTYTVTPSTLYFNGIPGQAISNVVLVENTTSQKINLDAKAYAIKVIDSAGHIRRTSAITKKSIASWIQVDQTSITLKPLEKKFIPFTVTIPADTEAGSYTGTLDFILQQDIVLMEKGTVVHVDVGKQVTTRLSLIDLKQRLEPERIMAQTVQVQLVNTGENMAQPVGEIRAVSLTGETIMILPVKNILIAPHKMLNVGYNVPVTVPGIYTVNLSLSYNRGLKHVVADTYLITPSLLFIFALTVFSSIIALYLHRHHKTWKSVKK